jgi:hypothetical protein
MSLKRKALYMTCLTTIFTLSLVSGVITLGANTLRATDITDLDFNEDPNGNAYKYKKGDGEVNKYALLIGISDYNVISDLNYADDDATDWFNFLITLDYQITLLGDSHPEDYPQWDGYATEYNVRVALENILAIADEDDIVVFATSGHGGRGRSTTLDEFVYYLCMWDTSAGENGYNGLITHTTELQEMMAPSIANTFIFIDHCYAGGFQNVMLNDNAEKIYLAVTCSDNGYGYDDPEHFNGAWTYWFLEYGLIGEFGGTASMEEVFDLVYPLYIDIYRRPGDWPSEFDGSLNTPFYL